MKLLINDKNKYFDIETLDELINRLKLNSQMLYLQVNGCPIEKDAYKITKLKENDNIDIIKAVGGG